MKKRFLFIVDSYCDGIREAVESIGFTHQDCNITGAGGAQVTEVESLMAEKLVVFMSSFHGDSKMPEKMAREIREKIPHAFIVWRSTQRPETPELFDQVMKKEFNLDHPQLVAIVRREFGIPLPTA